jgi:DNA polymerase-4
MPGVGATILHADLDAFYASVEQLLDPALRGKPIAVGGSAAGGVVLAASYEAKAFGVQGGMPGWRAARLCPHLRFVRGRFNEYQRLADAVMAILDDITPIVERISIDEAFLDVSGATHLFGAPTAIAQLVQRRVGDEIGLPISVGGARTKHLAKVASQVAKPAGIVIVEPGTEREFLDPLPVHLVWGVGPVTRQKLADRGITTIGQLAETPSEAVRHLLGEAVGTKLHALAADDDARRVRPVPRAASVGAQSALGRRSPSPTLLREVLGHLADRVASRLRAKDRAGRTVTVRVRFAGMRSVTRSLTLAAPIATTLTLTEIAVELAASALADHRDLPEISLLGLSVSNLQHQADLQLELPVLGDDPRRPGSPAGAARSAIDRSVDAVRERFGRDAVGYTSVQLSTQHTVPDEFRELAERDL